MNGMVTQLNLEADQPGLYSGFSAHFSGDGFSDMGFDLQAMPSEQFTVWTTSIPAQSVMLTNDEYRKLLQQSNNVIPYMYNGVSTNLFDSIVSQKLPPGDGPATGQPTPAVSPRQGN